MQQTNGTAPVPVHARAELARKRPPRPRGVPLLGRLPGLIRDAPAEFERLAARHRGALIEIDMGLSSAYLATTPAQAQYILADNWRNFSKQNPMWRVLRRLLGNGLASADGDSWLHNRRLIQPLFSTAQLAQVVERIVEVVSADVEQLAKRVDTGERVEIDEQMMHMTQRVILATMFGASVDAGATARLGAAIIATLDSLQPRMFLHFIPPALFPGERRLRRSIATLDQAILDIVEDRRARQRAGAAPDRADLLTLLLGLRDEQGSGMDDRQLRDELVTMFVAGNDTTAIAMTWMFYLLDQHPEVDRKVCEELDAVLGDRPPTSEALGQLRYCKMVIQEAMRMYPPSWILPRTALEDDEICGYPVPAGATVLISQAVIHNDPTHWEAPREFEPERFAPERAAARPRYAYLPFGGGPRQCLGNAFALLEGQVILATMRRRMRARLWPGHRVTAKAATLLRPRDGLPMTLHSA